MSAYTHPTKVMFQHCDPAGIVFYPRYYEMINALVETFFDEAIGWSFAEMHGVDGMGVPMGSLNTKFYKPSRLGDDLTWRLSVLRVGGASAELAISASGTDGLRLTAEATVVLVNVGKMRSTRWPDTIRARLLDFNEVAA